MECRLELKHGRQSLLSGKYNLKNKSENGVHRIHGMKSFMFRSKKLISKINENRRSSAGFHYAPTAELTQRICQFSLRRLPA